MIDTLVQLETTSCCSCGVAFAMPGKMLAERRENGANFWCPNGHTLRFTKSEAQRLREQLDRANAPRQPPRRPKGRCRPVERRTARCDHEAEAPGRGWRVPVLSPHVPGTLEPHGQQAPRLRGRCIVTTTEGRKREAPDGHRWVWRPTVFAEPLHVWEVLTAEHIGRRECRYGTRAGQPGCGDQAVARLNLARDHEWPIWAHYCGKHLLTRRIVDGELQTCVLEPIPAGEAA